MQTHLTPQFENAAAVEDARAARVKKTIDLIFTSPQNGIASEPTQLGFLALAKAGRLVWNSWLEEWPLLDGHSAAWPQVDFSNCNFEEDIDFSGFNFGDFANFQGATFVRKADFSKAIFGHGANFVGASFQEMMQFDNATFGSEAQFEATQFGFGASFNNAHFDSQATFFGAQFGDDSDFDGASFGEGARFDGCNWAVLRLRYSDQYGRRKEWGESQDMSPNKFEALSFRGCVFRGDVNFSNREFLGPATWEPLDGSPTTFHQVPKFHNCKLHQDTSFDRVRFPAATGSEAAARAYRVLKLAFAQQQATREEQRFFKLEMTEEHLSSEKPSRWLYSAYALFSDYGFSVWRPLILLLFAFIFSLLGYAILGGFSICIPFLSTCTLSGAWFEFGLVNAFPLPGLDKYAETIRSLLFPYPVHPTLQVMVTLLVILQKTFSLLAFFLIGLALRNLFKMK